MRVRIGLVVFLFAFVFLTMACAQESSKELQGSKGDRGNPGESITWKEEWEQGKTYKRNDGVTYEGASYVFNVESGGINNKDVPPLENPAEWQLLAAKGNSGSDGIQGELGSEGAQGEQGSEGVQGEQGIQGEQGPEGIQGERGDSGESPSEDELIELLNQIVNPLTPTPEPLEEGSYQAPNPRFVFSYTIGADEEMGGLDISLISDPVFDHPGCPEQAKVFGQSVRGDNVRCRFHPSLLLSWVKEFSLVTNLPTKDMEWVVYATFIPYQGPWPMPEEAQEPKPRFLVEFEEFEKKHSGNILLTVFPEGREPTPRCPDQADKTEGEREYYSCITSPEATLKWLQRFSLAEDLPPREEWEGTYAIFPALLPWEP